MGHNLKQTISLLTRTPAALDALLRGLPEDWVLRDEGEKTWSATEVVEHLIHGEGTDWIPRVRMILEFGENETFRPFDRGGHKRGPRTKSLEQLLEEFARVRSENLKELHALKLGRGFRAPGTASCPGSRDAGTTGLPLGQRMT